VHLKNVFDSHIHFEDDDEMDGERERRCGDATDDAFANLGKKISSTFSLLDNIFFRAKFSDSTKMDMRTSNIVFFFFHSLS
jgi:hypothetical protein